MPVGEIVEHLEDTSVVTIGHLVEGHDRPFIVVAASKSGDEYGGLMAIPQAMVTSFEVWADDPSPVPSVKAGMDLDGRPIKAAENWQQGICVVTYMPDDGPFAVELVAIHEGRAMFRGREYGA